MSNFYSRLGVRAHREGKKGAGPARVPASALAVSCEEDRDRQTSSSPASPHTPKAATSLPFSLTGPRRGHPTPQIQTPPSPLPAL